MFHYFNDQNMARFGQIDTRFGDMDARFDSVDAQFGEMRSMITYFAFMHVGGGGSSSGPGNEDNDGTQGNVGNLSSNDTLALVHFPN